jgi:hypothetical protein
MRKNPVKPSLVVAHKSVIVGNGKVRILDMINISDHQIVDVHDSAPYGKSLHCESGGFLFSGLFLYPAPVCGEYFLRTYIE